MWSEGPHHAALNPLANSLAEVLHAALQGPTTSVRPGDPPLTVFWDQACLGDQESGAGWEAKIQHGLANSTLVMPLVSRPVLDSLALATKRHTPVLLEWEITLERLKQGSCLCLPVHVVDITAEELAQAQVDFEADEAERVKLGLESGAGGSAAGRASSQGRRSSQRWKRRERLALEVNASALPAGPHYASGIAVNDTALPILNLACVVVRVGPGGAVAAGDAARVVEAALEILRSQTRHHLRIGARLQRLNAVLERVWGRLQRVLDERDVVGVGGNSVVYRGRLEGVAVVVKTIMVAGARAFSMKEFHTEVDIMLRSS